MRGNAERRAGLLDAAIAVLAERGAAALTYRAVDATAGVPPGTASNYFASRRDLLVEVGQRLYVRAQTSARDIAGAPASLPERERVRYAARMSMLRVLADPALGVATVELRLAALRDPALGLALARDLRAAHQESLEAQREAGMPGDAIGMLFVHVAMVGLLFETTTSPSTFDTVSVEEIVDRLVHYAT